MAIGTNRSQGRSIAGGRKFLGSSAKGYQVGQDRSQALAAIAQRKAAAEAKGNDKEAATWAMIGAVVLGTAAGFAAPGVGFALTPALMGAAAGGQMAYGAAKMSQDDPSGAAMVLSGLGTGGAAMAQATQPKQVAFSQEAVKGLQEAGVFSSNPADRAAAIQKLTPDQMDLIQQNPEKVMALLKLYQGQGG